jgi:hypothetical protein
VLISNADVTAATLHPSSSERRTIMVRPNGVVRAFLWRSSGPSSAVGDGWHPPPARLQLTRSSEVTTRRRLRLRVLQACVCGELTLGEPLALQRRCSGAAPASASQTFASSSPASTWPRSTSASLNESGAYNRGCEQAPPASASLVCLIDHVARPRGSSRRWCGSGPMPCPTAALPAAPPTCPMLHHYDHDRPPASLARQALIAWLQARA